MNNQHQAMPASSPSASPVLRGFMVDAEDALSELAARSRRTTVVVSTVRRVPPRRQDDTQQRDRVITAAVLNEGEIRGYYEKCSCRPTACSTSSGLHAGHGPGTRVAARRRDLRVAIAQAWRPHFVRHRPVPGPAAEGPSGES